MKGRRFADRLFLIFQWFFIGVLSVCILPAEASDSKEPGYEMLVIVYADQIGSIELPTVISGTEIYLPVVDVFHFLGINGEASDALNQVSGFFINRENAYSINLADSRIIYQNKTYSIEPGDLIKTETNIYLKSDHFKLFGLECNFNFRALSVSIRSETELPLVRKKRQEAMRANINRLKREQIADKILGSERSLFQIGAADWSVNSRQEASGSTNTWVRLGVGGTLAGGELEGQFNYSNNQPFRERNQYYRWRYANNDLRLVRQLMVGKVALQSISTIFTPVVGVQATNTPTTRKASFGTYTLEEYTSPGWTAELYVNNILVDYTKADASGHFSFDIPLVYGNTDITIRYYSPWGEEQTETRSISIPYVLLPPQQLEYTVSSGIVQNGTGSLFSQGRFHYGLSRNITVGGGLEYFSSVSSGQYMPFFNTSMRLGRSVLFTGEYAHGVRYKGGLSYFSSSRLRFEVNHTQYEQGQEAVRYNYTRETEASIGMPFRLLKANFNSRLTVSRSSVSAIEYNTAGLDLSGSFRGVSLRISSHARSMQETDPFIYTNLSTSLLLPGRFIFDAKARYEYQNDQFSNLQVGLKRNFFGNGSFTLSYERNLTHDLNFLHAGLVYNFGFASLAFASTHGKNGTSFYESANGSIIHEPKTQYVDFNRTRSTGKGGIILLPFLDINGNEKRDPDEPKVSGLHATGSGRIEKNLKDSTIVITGLEPYTNYFVELDGRDIYNISWQIKHSSLSIAVEPNRLRLVEIPITVMGEASGMVYLNKNNEQQGIGRIKVSFYDMYSRLVASTLTESDGYFSHLGLPTGLYHVRIDSGQLNNLQMTSSPTQRSFVIQEKEEGDFIDDLKFVLRSAQNTSSVALATEEAKESFGVQLMATSQKIALDHTAFHGLKDIQVHYMNNMYYYTWGNVGSMEHARILENELKDRGFTSAVAAPFAYNQNEGARTTLTEHQKGPASGAKLYGVQILAAQRKIKPNHSIFKGLKDIKEHFRNGLYKYTWGEVKSEEDARILQNELMDRGFDGTLIVSFDGNEIIAPHPVSASDEKIDLPETTGLVFKVQILATRKKVPVDHVVFNGLDGVKMYYHDQYYKYTWGEVENLEHAMILKNELGDRGFSEAFVVPFYKGERVLADNLSNGRQAAAKHLVFRVQVMASRNNVPLTHPLLKGLQNVNVYHDNGLYKYTWGETSSYNEAMKILKDLKQHGFTGVKILSFYK